MATENLDVNVNVNTTQAQRNLTALNKSVVNLEATFGKLQGILAGLGISNAITKINNLALGIKQASSASEVSIATITDFSNAVGSVGGNAERAVGDVIDFVAGLREAKDGSAAAQTELKQVGISLQDLATLSNEDIFKKTIQGLAQIEDSSLRNSLALKLLGKNFKDIDVRQVASVMGTTGGANVSAITAAADAQIALNKNLNNFIASLTNALEPLNKLISRIDVSVQTFDKLLAALAAIAMVASLFFAWTKILKVFELLKPVAAGIAVAFTDLSTVLVNLYRNFGLIVKEAGSLGGVFKPVWIAIKAIGSAIIEALIPAIVALEPLWKPIAIAAAGVFGWLSDNIDGLINKAQSLIEALSFGTISFNKAGAGRGDGQAELEARRKQLEEQNKKQQQIVDGQRQQKLELDKQLRGYQSQNAELSRSLAFQNSLIGMDETRANRVQKLFDLETNYLNEVKSIQTKYNDLKAAAAVGTQQEKDAFAAFAAVYQTTLAQIKKEYQGQVSEVNQLINQEEILKAKEKDRQNILDAITQQMERQVNLADQLRSANDKLKDVQFEAAQMKRSPLEQSVAKIQEDARKAALEAGRAFAQAFEDSGDGLTPEKAKELADGLDQIAQRYKAIADAQTENLLASRTWEQGWKEAFDNYMENATNAAKQAGEVFNSITSNMEKAIDNFVTTGKFSFGDLARSIIQDLIKIELKAQATAMFKAVAGTAGTFLSSIFGFAAGGNPPINKPSIVGENGPELFVPRTAGTIIPNGGVGAMGGGMMNAPITNNYITNNISAVDAKSVAQLFAENRKTLLGTVQMAQKELPYSNR